MKARHVLLAELHIIAAMLCRGELRIVVGMFLACLSRWH